MPYQIGIGKIYDPELLYKQKNEPYFKKEFELAFTGIGNRVFSDSIILQSVDLGAGYLNEPISPYTEKYIMCDPAFYGSKFGVVVNEIVEGNIRVLFADDFHRKDTQTMIDKIFDLRAKFRNVKNIFIDASATEFIVDIKQYFENTGYEYPEQYNEKIREWWTVYKKKPWEMNMYVIPVPFNKRVEYTQRLHKAMSSGVYWINESFDKLIMAYETATAEEDNQYDADKEHMENSDVFDAQLCLFHRFKPL
jgi:hypothetical protein